MNSDELAEYLNQYVGRRIRVWSQLTGEGMSWLPGRYPILASVMAAPKVGTTHTRVWCTYEGGIGFQVDDNGLTLELEPAVGTYDFALGRDQMEAIGTAIRRYGPTENVLRNRCNCIVCQAMHYEEDEAVQETFKDAWNHGPTSPELELDGW